MVTPMYFTVVKNPNILWHYVNQQTSWDEAVLSTAYRFYWFCTTDLNGGKNFTLACFHTICSYSNWVSIAESGISVGFSKTILRHFTVWMQWEQGLLATAFQHGDLNVLMISYCSFHCSQCIQKKWVYARIIFILLHQKPFT